MKRVYMLFTLLCLTIIGCSHSSDRTLQDLTYSFQHPETGQPFQIIKAYQLFDDYISEAEKNPDKPLIDVYKETVIDPIYDACFKDAEYPFMGKDYLEEAPDRFTEIKIYIEQLENESIIEAIKDSLIKSSTILPYEIETTVCVFPTPGTPRMVNLGAGKIIIPYNQYITEELVKAGVAHEYHHSYWTAKYYQPNKYYSVLENLVFEGKAVMFERTVYPEIEFFHIENAYHQQYWDEVKDDLHKMDLHRSLEVLDGGGNLPPYYGYGEGYKMVKSFIEEHPHLSPVEWTSIEAKDIFEKGNYARHYE